MTDSTYHPASFRSVLLGIALFALLLVLFLSLSDVVKVVGYPLMWLPGKLGLIRVVGMNEVQVLSLNEQDLAVTLDHPGRYVIYVSDGDLLLNNDALAEKNGAPWVQLHTASGEDVPSAYVHRGLLPFDTPFARGRPVLTLTVSAAGRYTITHPRRPASISILPDYVTGSEGVLWVVMLAELAGAAYLISWLTRGRRRRRAERVKEIDALKRIQGDEFWKSELERRNKKRAR